SPEAHVHPVKASLSLARAARQKGAGIASGIAAKGLVHQGGRVIAVETSAGRVEPRFVVSATGWTADWLRGALPELPPLRSVSGQLISSDPLPPLLNGPVAGSYLGLQLPTGGI